MTEYLVQELSETHINFLREAEESAEEMAALSKKTYGVYVLLSEFPPATDK